MRSQHVDRLKEILARIKREQAELLRVQAEMRADIKQNKMPLPDLVDASFFLNELAGDDGCTEIIRKECDAQRGELARILCSIWLAQRLSDPETGSTLTGQYAQGRPDVKHGANLPKKGSDDMRKLMEFAGMREYTEDTVLRIHWPRLVDLITARTKEGLPPPPGIPAELVYPIYQMTHLRLNKGVTL